MNCKSVLLSNKKIVVIYLNTSFIGLFKHPFCHLCPTIIIKVNVQVLSFVNVIILLADLLSLLVASAACYCCTSICCF